MLSRELRVLWIHTGVLKGKKEIWALESITFTRYADTRCRTPVVIFLSDGLCRVKDETISGICREAVRRGFVWLIFDIFAADDSMNARRPLSFHAVSFGLDATSSSLRRMAQIALDIQNNAPQDPLLPATTSVPSSYTEALDTVRDERCPHYPRELTRIFIRFAWQRPS